MSEIEDPSVLFYHVQLYRPMADQGQTDDRQGSSTKNVSSFARSRGIVGLVMPLSAPERGY